MRQNLTIALLAVCATLLAVNLAVSLSRPQVVLGQAAGVAGGNYVMATGQTVSGNEAVLYVLDTATKKLACYATRTRGIDFRGVRTLQYDLMPEYLVPSRNMKPSDVKKVLESQR